MSSSEEEYKSDEEDEFWKGIKRQKMTSEERTYGIFGDYPSSYGSKANLSHNIRFKSAGSLQKEINDSDPETFDVKPAKGGRPNSPLPKNFGRGGTYSSDDEFDDFDEVQKAASFGMQFPKKSKATATNETGEQEGGGEELETRPSFSSSSSSGATGGAGLGYNNLPTQFGSKGSVARRGKRSRFLEKMEENDEIKKNVGANLVKRDKLFGAFQKHTSSFAEKIMKKMGWQGGGLGKAEQGRVVPVLASKRSRNSGLGFNNQDRMQDKESDVFQKRLDERNKVYVRGITRLDVWKKKAKKTKVVYKTAQDLLEEKDKAPKRTETIIDHTRPGEAVSVNISEIDSAVPTLTSEGLIPELQFNVSKLVDKAEEEILVLSTKLRKSKQGHTTIMEDRTELEKRTKEEQTSISQLEELLKVLEELDEQAKAPTGADGIDEIAKLEGLAKSFENIQHKFRREYTLHGLAGLLLSLVFPIMTKYISTWSPIEDPGMLEKVIKRWRPLLSGEQMSPAPFEDTSVSTPLSIFNDPTGSRHLQQQQQQQELHQPQEEESADVFTELAESIIIPEVRRVLINYWAIKDKASCEKCVHMLDTLKSYLPHGIVFRLLDTLVMPNIVRTVNGWQPSQDQIPVSDWILPWIPLLGDKLLSVYETIQKKIAQVLVNWQPTDKTAKYILSPWKNIFSKTLMNKTLKSYIVPRLNQYLQGFVINPQNQDLETIKNVIFWKDLLEQETLIKMLEKHFFPKWLSALYAWLSPQGPDKVVMADFTEVVNWYRNWKKLFGVLSSSQRFEAQLTIALDMMNAICLHETLPPLSMILERSKMAYASVPSKQQKRPQKEPRHHIETTSLTFRETVEQFALKKGIDFTPNLRLGHHQGHQIFKFGSKNVYLSSNMIFMKTGDEWESTTLDALVKEV